MQKTYRAQTTRLQYRQKHERIRSVLPSQPERENPNGIPRHLRPFIEDVDDRLHDLIQGDRDSCQKYPLDKETFF